MMKIDKDHNSTIREKRKPKLKTELYHDNFQNYKRYGIPKAQLVIADNKKEKVIFPSQSTLKNL